MFVTLFSYLCPADHPRHSLQRNQEVDIVYKLMQRAVHHADGNPLPIITAFARPSITVGVIYIEAWNEQDIRTSCDGMAGVYLHAGICLVPLGECSALLAAHITTWFPTPYCWVKIKSRGVYHGDLDW